MNRLITIFTFCCAFGFAEGLYIEHFGSNGELRFSQIPEAVKYHIEWSSSGFDGWRRSWRDLVDIEPKDQKDQISCKVPMFYRVVADLERQPKTKVVLFGDSLTAQNSTYVEHVYEPKYYSEALGYFNWARGFAKYPVELLTNLGVGGETTVGMLARIDDVIATGADIAIVCGGRNDVSRGWENGLEISISNLTEIVTRLLDANMKVVLMNVPPVTSIESTARVQHRDGINSWIATARNMEPDRLRIVDVETAITDYETTAMMPYMAHDEGTHWSQVAAARIGMKVAVALDELVFTKERHWKVDAESDAIGNSKFSNDGEGWELQGAGSVHYKPSYEYDGNIAILQVEEGPRCSILYLENIEHGRYSPGDQIILKADIEWEIETLPEGDQAFYPFGWVRSRNYDGSFEKNYYFLNSASRSSVPIPLAPRVGRGVWQTPVYTVGDNVDRIYYYLGFQGIQRGRIIIHRMNALKVNQ